MEIQNFQKNLIINFFRLFPSVFVIIIDVLNDTYMEHKKKVGQSNEEDK